MGETMHLSTPRLERPYIESAFFEIVPIRPNLSPNQLRLYFGEDSRILVFRPDANESAGRPFVWGEVVDSRLAKEPTCGLCSTPLEDPFYDSVTLEILGGPELLPIVPTEEAFVVTYELATKLEDSGLTGVRYFRPEILANQSLARDADIAVLSFSRDGLSRPKSTMKTFANECQFCGFSPLICPKCRSGDGACPKCRRRCITAREMCDGPDDPRYSWEEVFPPESIGENIVCLSGWTEVDFSGGFYPAVTRRALQLMIDEGVVPMVAIPQRAYVDDLDDEELAHSWETLSRHF